MSMDAIGFYTLSDRRCRELSFTSPIYRAEFVLSEVCNFSCPYCRGLDSRFYSPMTLKMVLDDLNLLKVDGLVNVRFSGGEPTLLPVLPMLVSAAKSRGVKRVAVSTNGSAPWTTYHELIKSGVDDFSVSLDACCASGCEMMGGHNFLQMVDNILRMSSLVYTTVGIVVNEINEKEVSETVALAKRLGVQDIRIISSAQYNQDTVLASLEEDVKYPIFSYRVRRAKEGLPIRGALSGDFRRCSLVVDDVAIMGEYHYPCIIYMRERGEPIGKMGPGWREDRIKWYYEHDIMRDVICYKNCLDVCQVHNQRCAEIKGLL